jgi:hypothetical protein
MGRNYHHSFTHGYYYNNDMTFKGTYAWDKTLNVMSLTTRLLVIENGQNVHVEI